MRPIYKWALGIVGVLMIGLAVYQIGWWLKIPGLTAWSHQVAQQVPGMAYWISAGMAVSGLVGLGLLGLGVLAPIRIPQTVLKTKLGTMAIPQRVLEKNLRYYLVDQLGLIDPQVTVRLRRRQRVIVRVDATTQPDHQLRDMALRTTHTVKTYLQNQLGMHAVIPVVRLAPVDRQRPVKVL